MKARVGISSCLLGANVRWDGGHKRADWLDDLSRELEWVAVCPEVELGLGVPREPIQLVAREGVRLLGRESGADHTGAMRAFAERRADELRAAGIAGYVLKSRSPSCGLSVGVVGGEPARGRFAEVLATRWPGLPIAEEEGLRGAEERAIFIARVRAFRL
jgi:uncharacterized protein YbbK (DUF523 family)